MICAIHQPNFMPWLPYFLKIRQADIFVILAAAQFSKAFYQHRFNIGDVWYTMPTVHGDIPIKNKLYLEPKKNWDKIKRRLPQDKKVLDRFDDCIGESLCATNTNIIRKICGALAIPLEKVHTDHPTDLTQNDRNIDIRKHFGCDTYLSGTGARKYNDEKKFSDANIKLIYQEVQESEKIPILEVLCRLDSW